MRQLFLALLLSACTADSPRSPCGPAPDHLARDHFENCVGPDRSLLCCLDALEECLDPHDPWGVHECAEPEPCLVAYGGCEERLRGAPLDFAR